jgi:hypothetical protein
MSTDISLIHSQLPAELIEQLKVQADLERARLGNNSEADVIRVSQNKKFQFPKSDELVDEFDAVIVNFAFRNNYYLGRYNPKEVVPPACFAISENSRDLVPSVNSPKIQADDCASCQQNQFGSSPTGGGKACKNTVVIGVVPADDQENHPIMVVNVSPTSLTAFNKYVNHVMDKTKLTVQTVVTKFYFDPKSDYPSIRFEMVAPNTKIMETFARKDEALRRVMAEPDVSGFSEGKK